MKFSWLSHAPNVGTDLRLAESTPGPLIIVVGFGGLWLDVIIFDGSILMGAIALLGHDLHTLSVPLFSCLFSHWVPRGLRNPVGKASDRSVPKAHHRPRCCCHPAAYRLSWSAECCSRPVSKSPNLWAATFWISVGVLMIPAELSTASLTKPDRLSR